jgi:hypothetical protein
MARCPPGVCTFRNLPMRASALSPQRAGVGTLRPRVFRDGTCTSPIEAGIHTGADEVYAVVCSQDKMSPEVSVRAQSNLSSYAPPANLLDVGMRAASDIMPSEINGDQLYPPPGWGKEVIVIRSEYDIHDSMTIDPGADPHSRGARIYAGRRMQP